MAHLRAKDELIESDPGIVAQPAFSTNGPWSQAFTFFSWSCCTFGLTLPLKLARQIGASAAITAASDFVVATALDLLAVTHPPKVKPRMAVATAPPAALRRTGVSLNVVCII